jgi:hypothetical protein
MGHQNSPRQTLVNVGVSVSNGGVRRLHHKDLSEFKQQIAQWRTGVQGVAQFIGFDPLPFARDLDVGRMRRLAPAKRNGYAAHSLAADETNFECEILIREYG